MMMFASDQGCWRLRTGPGRVDSSGWKEVLALVGGEGVFG